MNKFLILVCVLMLFLGCVKNKEIDPTVQIITAPTEGNSAQPFLFSNERTLMSWIENEKDSLYTLKYAEFLNEKWDSARTIVTGTNWFVNWADFPAIAENNSLLLTHFLQMSAEGTYTYDIRMKLSAGTRNSWRDDFLLHDDKTKSEHGFVTMLPYRETSFFATWLDGRNTVGGEKHGANGAMTLRAAEVTSNGIVIDELELDAKTCDCCQTGAAITKNGPVVVYRDRSDDEIRDIYITRKVDSIWSKPKPVFSDNWKIAGCPVNGPRVDAIDNILGVIWYTGANEVPRVKLAFSKNSGVTFNEPIVIDEVLTIGRVDVALIDKNNAIVSWITSQDFKTVLKAMKVNLEGEKGKEIVVSEMNPSRASGFPQLEIVNNSALFAWTTILNDRSTITTATISLTDF